MPYLDWAATAPLSPTAAAAMADAAARLATGEWANPSSVHAAGRAARRALAKAREKIAGLLRVPPDALIFTSGATEALTLALKGMDAPARLVGATEHAAVLEAAADAARVPVDGNGLIRLDELRAMLDRSPPGTLVAIQHASNESGVVQDAAAIAGLVHERDGLLLMDVVQSAMKLPIPNGADLLALSAHKLGGPAGVGLLVARCRDGLRPVQRGGGQEQGLRGGTENLLGIIGFAAALEAFDPQFTEHTGQLQARLEQAAIAAGARVNGAGAPRLPNISSLRLPGVPASTQLMRLDMAGIAVSQGAACSSGTLKPSAALEAMGDPAAARESIRISIGWSTTPADIDRFLTAWTPLARTSRAA